MPPANWMNDPDGFIRWGDTYHLFYQHNPNAPVWDRMHWGHASSKDLVSWTHLPIAMFPDRDYDADGVWSGCCIDHGGVPTIVYTGITQGVGGRIEKVALATSDDRLLEWRKSASAVIDGPPPGMPVIGFRDPFVFSDGQGGWQLILGSGTRAGGGQILIYRSADLQEWRYAGVMLDQSRVGSPLTKAPMWEFPQIVRLPGRDVVMFTPLDGKTQDVPVAIEGLLVGDEFKVDRVWAMDGGPAYSSPCVFNESSERSLAFSWLHELSSQATQLATGWSGVMSLPREFRLDAENRLIMAPAVEVLRLRRTGQRIFDDNTLDRDASFALPDGPIEIELAGDLRDRALRLCFYDSAAPTDDHEAVLELSFDMALGEMGLTVRSDARFCPDAPEVRGTVPVDGRLGGKIEMRVFVDNSVVEVFANRHAVLTGRLYRADRLRAGRFFVSGKIPPFERLHLWRLAIPT
jgi:beta-fructofuranosidase